MAKTSLHTLNKNLSLFSQLNQIKILFVLSLLELSKLSLYVVTALLIKCHSSDLKITLLNLLHHYANSISALIKIHSPQNA